MSIFDLRNLGLVTAVKLKSKIKTMAFSGDETIIAFALDNKVKMILNPLKANEIKVFGPGFDKYKFLKYISDIMLDDYTEHKPEMDQ